MTLNPSEPRRLEDITEEKVDEIIKLLSDRWIKPGGNYLFKIHPEQNLADLVEDKNIGLEELGMLYCIRCRGPVSLKELVTSSKDGPKKTEYLVNVLIERELIVAEKGVSND